jgi:hypothetical protein
MRAFSVIAVLSFLQTPVAPLIAAQREADHGSTVTLADSTSVPMEVPDGRAIVRVALNGQGPYRLAVETGSPEVRVSTKVIADLGLKTGGMGDEDSTYVLDSLRIGGALIRSLAVSRSSAFERLGVDGVLGLEAYRDLLLTVDYPNQRLSLATTTLPAPDGREILKATHVGPFIGIPIALGDVKEIGVIDTQGGVGFAAIEEVGSRLTFQTPLRVVGRAVVGGGAPVPVKQGVLAGSAMLGRHRISQPPVAVHALPPDIPSHVTIGLRVLRNFAVAIDQRTMAVRLVRPDSSQIRL